MSNYFKGLEDKKLAIEKHRQMWRWITDQINTETYESIMALKRRYLDMCENSTDIDNDCYLCEFMRCILNLYPHIPEIDGCRYCPVEWGADDSISGNSGLATCMDDNGLYERISKIYADRELMRSLASQIADLPEKELPAI